MSISNVPCGTGSVPDQYQLGDSSDSQIRYQDHHCNGSSSSGNVHTVCTISIDNRRKHVGRVRKAMSLMVSLGAFETSRRESSNSPLLQCDVSLVRSPSRAHLAPYWLGYASRLLDRRQENHEEFPSCCVQAPLGHCVRCKCNWDMRGCGANNVVSYHRHFCRSAAELADGRYKHRGSRHTESVSQWVMYTGRAVSE
jgi:hypothetical protein